jgi:hypothetical protein
MHLRSIRLKNIKCFRDLQIDFGEDILKRDLSKRGEIVRRWTTLFGRNALGKSTLLQAMGAVLAGPSAMRELLPVAAGWVRVGEPYGEISAELLWTDGDAAPPGPRRYTPYVMQYLVSGSDPSKLPPSVVEKPSVPEMVPWSGEPGATKADAKTRQRDNNTRDRRLLQETAYAENTQGWLACGYGPFRRLSGGSEQSNSIVSAGRRAARFVTLFREDAALTNATRWLTELHNLARESDARSQKTLEIVKNSLASKLFPEKAELVVTAKSAFLKRNGSTEILFQDLSDGYRSMLALSIDLLHWLTDAFPNEDNPFQCSGVALVDELDTHLHPSWQRMIGHWLREKFPNIQFIVATHSPFLAQVADPDAGDTATPADPNAQSPGNIRLKETPQGVIAEPSAEAARWLGPEQILQSDLFDMSTVVSPQVEQRFERFDQLRQKRTAKDLSVEEAAELQRLQLELELLPAASTAAARTIEASLQGAVQKLANKIGSLE